MMADPRREENKKLKYGLTPEGISPKSLQYVSDLINFVQNAPRKVGLRWATPEERRTAPEPAGAPEFGKAVLGAPGDAVLATIASAAERNLDPFRRYSKAPFGQGREAILGNYDWNQARGSTSTAAHFLKDELPRAFASAAPDFIGGELMPPALAGMTKYDYYKGVSDVMGYTPNEKIRLLKRLSQEPGAGAHRIDEVLSTPDAYFAGRYTQPRQAAVGKQLTIRLPRRLAKKFDSSKPKTYKKFPENTNEAWEAWDKYVSGRKTPVTFKERSHGLHTMGGFSESGKVTESKRLREISRPARSQKGYIEMNPKPTGTALPPDFRTATPIHEYIHSLQMGGDFPSHLQNRLEEIYNRHVFYDPDYHSRALSREGHAFRAEYPRAFENPKEMLAYALEARSNTLMGLPSKVDPTTTEWEMLPNDLKEFVYDYLEWASHSSKARGGFGRIGDLAPRRGWEGKSQRVSEKDLRWGVEQAKKFYRERAEQFAQANAVRMQQEMRRRFGGIQGNPLPPDIVERMRKLGYDPDDIRRISGK